MNEHKKVLVLMSTYNGERFISKQLDSILCQENVAVKLLIRDDGSKDGTIEILNNYRSMCDLEIITGENLKPAQSFRKLVQVCDSSYDYYAYADQDDIWHPEKLKRAVDILNGHDPKEPALWYCGISCLVDNVEKESYCCSLERASEFEAIVKTFSTTNGCTMVFNKQLLHILRSCDPGEIDMHDSWTHAMCVACGGKVYCDPMPGVKYRIHDGQVLGSQTKTALACIKRFLKAKCLRSETIETMLTSSYIEESKRKYLEELVKYKHCLRVKLKIVAQKTKVMSKKEHMEFVIKIITNKF